LIARVFGAVLLLGCGRALADGAFSVDGLAGWDEQTFVGRGTTRYQLVDDRGTQVLEAHCDRSASGLIRVGPVALAQAPVLHWRWRAETLLPPADERTREGDDFPLRVYVVHHGGLSFWKTRSLVYVWSRDAEPGTHWPSAYTGNALVIALHSGGGDLGTWQEERRDVRRDFHDYFGLDLDSIDAVALMTDCDDSNASVRAWYGDLRFEAP
jgi:hypothetical protein